MGTDISGWVEVKRAPDESWTALMPIDSIVDRSYGMFASLFGIRNQGHYLRPIAARRGMAPDATGLFKSEHDAYGGAVGTTRVLWSELSDVNWDEEGRSYTTADDLVSWTPGPGGRPERREDYLNGGWAVVLKIMEVLAGEYGGEYGGDNVRLSVWFDQE